jgi:glycosyltransferase involved in cell wall biosynthesis
MERSQPVFRALGHARRWAARGAALSAVSSVAAEAVERVAGAPVAVLHNGIDADQWARPVGLAPSRPEAAVRVVTAMRLAARKRPGAAVAAVAAARDLLPPGRAMTVDILGEGPDRRRLERQVHRLGLHDVVRLPGRVSRAELRRRYWAADLYLSPARLEAFGLAALEARSAGLPVLARAGTGVGDFVEDGVNGLLAADDESFAACLAKLVLDDDLRTSLAAHSRTVAPAQDWPRIAQQTLAEYARAGAA